jgi:hypothetical protein
MTTVLGVSGVTGAREVRPGHGNSNQLRTGGALPRILQFVQNDKPGLFISGGAKNPAGLRSEPRRRAAGFFTA